MTILTVGLALVAVMLFAMNRVSHRKRIGLTSYATYLLLNDEIRNDHQNKFVEFIREQDGDALDVSVAATGAIEKMAAQLASAPQSSVLAAHHLINSTRVESGQHSSIREVSPT